jgi:hypothetical protein
MKDSASGGFVQGFNAQAVVDQQQQIIVAAPVTKQPTDKMQLGKMGKQTKWNPRAAPLPDGGGYGLIQPSSRLSQRR